MRQAPLASEAEIEAMHERLRKKVNGGSGELAEVGSGAIFGSKSEQLPDGAKPSPSSSAKPLEWEKPKSKDSTGLYTTCKRYSCAKVTVNGKTSYELFKLAPGGGWFRSLNAGLDNFLQVQKLAQIDADKGTP